MFDICVWELSFWRFYIDASTQFPFVDNVFRAGRSGVKYMAAPTGSQNDQAVFDTAEKLGITFVEQSVRLVHH